jgi:biopolymer transport protein ExbD
MLDRGHATINMTPMIDIVFQLLIFFLVSSHIARQESQMALPLPVAESGKEDITTPHPRVTINVLPDRQVVLAGRRIDLAELPQRLERVVAQEGRDVEIRIRSDRRVPYRDIEPILSSCAQVGVWNVAFAVHRSQDQGPP